MKPWLNGAQLTHRFFGEEFWPVAHAGRLHRGELLLLLLEAPLPLPDPPPASSVENSEESDAESEAGEADSEAHSAQVGNEADSEAGAAASAVASAPASEQAPVATRPEPRIFKQLDAQWWLPNPSGLGIFSLMLGRREGIAGALRGAVPFLNAPLGPFVGLGRLFTPKQPWPEFPSNVREHPSLAPWLYKLPRLGLYAGDYGAQYAENRVEVVLLHVVTLGPRSPPAPIVASALASALANTSYADTPDDDDDNSGDDNSRDAWYLRPVRPELTATAAAARTDGKGDSGRFQAGATYLVATKICGDQHVPMGASTFAIELLDAQGNAALPQLHTAVAPQVLGAEAAARAARAGVVVRWAGWGCLSYQGFRNFSFTDGQIEVVSGAGGAPRVEPRARANAEKGGQADGLQITDADDSFEFAWSGESRHRYHRLPVDDAAFSLAS